jgi:thioredoxin-related protein
MLATMYTRARLALLLFAASLATASATTWLDDLEIAAQRARVMDRPLLINFTGSDWCSWCMRLDQEVFSSPEFTRFAEEHLVCVRLDYPRRRTLTARVAEQNTRAAQRYRVDRFPTIILVGQAGQEIARTGYRPGGPAMYRDHLLELLGARPPPAATSATPAPAAAPDQPPATPAEPASPDYRLWVAANGDAVEARLLKREGDSIQVVTRQGKTVTLDLRKLDPEDRTFVDRSGL